MTAGLARPLSSLGSARPALWRAARLALMLGPMIGPLAGTGARAAGPVVTGVQAPPWGGATGDERPALRRGAFSPVGSEPRPTAVAALAATPADATRTWAGTTIRRRPAAVVEWGWASRGGLAVHPVRRVMIARAPRLPGLPSLAAALDAPVDPPALTAPDPLPRFAALVPPAAMETLGPKREREPLIAGRPASPAKRQARRARRGRLAIGPDPGSPPSGKPTAGEQASAGALLRFLSTTEPGTWAAPAARTAELNRSTGTIRR